MELPQLAFRDYVRSRAYESAEHKVFDELNGLRLSGGPKSFDRSSDYTIVLSSDDERTTTTTTTATTSATGGGEQIQSIVQHLKLLGLIVREDPTKVYNCTLLGISASSKRLEEEAEKMGLKMRLKRGGYWHFERRTRSHFLGTADPKTIFRSSQRQAIINHIIRSSAVLKSCPLIENMFPLHKHTRHNHLRRKWVTFYANSGACQVIREAFTQPLDAIAEYYGEYVAFYFAFLQSYCRWLVAPSIGGIVVMWHGGNSLDGPLIPVYALFLGVWATLFIEFWRRRTNVLAYRWGVFDYEEQYEEARPEFRGKQIVVDHVSGETEMYYSRYKRWATIGCSWIFTLMCACVMCATMVLILVKQDELQSDPDGEAPPLGWEAVFTSIVWGVLIPVTDLLFNKAATIFTNIENHRTDSKYRSHFIVKVFSFRFVNNFISLYYYAFSGELAVVRLTAQLASFLITGQLLQLLISYGIPALQYKKSTIRLRAAVATAGGTVSDMWQESVRPALNEIDDYTSLIIQIGYVTFFSIALPLGPLLVLIVNLVRIRLDARRLCDYQRRPVATKTSGIGVWIRILDFMSVAAAITNCCLIGFTSTQISRWYPHITTSGKLVIVFVFEHILLGMKFMLAFVVPNMPRRIRRELKREHREMQQSHTKVIATLPPTRGNQALLEFINNPKY